MSRVIKMFIPKPKDASLPKTAATTPVLMFVGTSDATALNSIRGLRHHTSELGYCSLEER